ncbi:MAG: pyruvate, phosphate dikinase, partial [Elusimicrobia bacterium]|nr:pyruvate, phosphate dikinase [Elusimicrobiota bacterium]
MAKKYVYFFGGGKADGVGTMKDLLGGKGAGLAEMSRSGVPVPPGFTVTTETCRYYYAHGRKTPPELQSQFKTAMTKLEKVSGKKFGDAQNPLLVSVRSGAKFSMPGMMDTILNLGINDSVIPGLIALTENPRFVWDSYRRFVQMFGNVVMDVEKSEFEHILTEKKKQKGAVQDTQLTAEDLQDLVRLFKSKYQEKTNQEFPQDPWKQLVAARDAVFKSWNNERAISYRRLNKIPDDLGTAVNVQTMVFGNMGNSSGTGVGFTRNPSSGNKEFFGEYLTNAQGEDVVAGVRTPKPITELKNEIPACFQELKKITSRLERHYRDVQDFEFTIEREKLYMLQTRTGKRTGIAAVKIAVDMVHEKLISKNEALLRVEPDQLSQLLAPVFNELEKKNATQVAKGINAGPGAASGRVAFSAEHAVTMGKEGPVVLVRPETNPDDIEGMDASVGILTAIGGRTSHAAVVARGMGKPCVVGCSALKIDEQSAILSVDGHQVKEGEPISIDGPTLPSEVVRVLKGEMNPKSSELYQIFKEFTGWADQARKLKVRANADIPRDAKIARGFGAEGIGLCRTEHMFFAEERLPYMQQMILANNVVDRKKALDALLPFQKEDFKGLFREMRGFPVTIRTLDPPLHEFLPKTQSDAEALGQKLGISTQ